MKSPHSDLQTRPRRAFSLVEMMVACGLLSIVGLVMFSILNSGLIMFAQTTTANLSGLRGRQTLDRINDLVRYAESSPQLIDASGVPATGNTAPGIMTKIYLGGPYLVKKTDGTTGDIAATTTAFQLQYTSALSLPEPGVGDYLLIDSLARPELEITQVVPQSNITVGGQTIKCVNIVTKLAIGETVKPSVNRVAGYLQRREALVFAAGAGGTELRRYRRVISTTNFQTASNYQVLQGGYETLSSKPYFQLGTDKSLAINIQVHASGKTEYVELLNGSRTLTTLPVRATLRNIASK